MSSAGPTWNAEKEIRLIEMHQGENTVEEMARELGLPLDVIEKRLRALRLADDEADLRG